MSKLLQPKISPKNRKIDWINHICSAHGLVCGCDEPLKHTVEEIFEQEPEIKEILLKCPGRGEDHTTAADDLLGDGVLDALFTDDFGDAEKDATDQG